MPDLPEVKPNELELAKQIIQQIAHDTFSPGAYKDEVKTRMMQLIQQKVDGQEITAAPEAPEGKIIDLMEALKASLGMKKDAERLPAKAAEPPAEVAEVTAVAEAGAKKKSRKR
jgi:DNA end-binding protein Ku